MRIQTFCWTYWKNNKHTIYLYISNPLHQHTKTLKGNGDGFGWPPSKTNGFNPLISSPQSRDFESCAVIPSPRYIIHYHFYNFPPTTHLFYDRLFILYLIPLYLHGIDLFNKNLLFLSITYRIIHKI